MKKLRVSFTLHLPDDQAEALMNDQTFIPRTVLAAAEQGEDLLGIAESLRHVDSRVTRQSYIGLDSGRGALTRQRVSSVYAQMSG